MATHATPLFIIWMLSQPTHHMAGALQRWGQTAANLFRDFLAVASSSLKKGAHLCISSPEEIQVDDYARESGLRMREKHLARVHRSLTRQFVVLQNA